MRQFLDAFTPDHLPRQIRAAFAREIVPSLLRACAVAGVRPMISTDLADFWSICQGDVGRAIASQFVDPAIDPTADAGNTAFVILHRDGKPVASAGARLRWVPGTLGEAVVDGSLLYPHGTPRDFRAHCVASGANAIGKTTIAVYTGYWRAPTENPRDPVPMHLAVRLLHAYTLGAWGWTHGVSFAEDGVALKFAHPVWLAETIQPGIAWRMMGKQYRLNLVLASRDSIINKLLDIRSADPTAMLHLAPDVEAEIKAEAARRAVA